MSVTITITDPTEAEARRVADYLMELGGYRSGNAHFDVSVLADNPTSVATENIASSNVLVENTEPIVVIPPPPEIPTLFTPPPAPTGTVELDAAGMPWDGRIHSDTKNKIGDGYWRTRRGADPAVVAAVTAELKAAMAAPGVMLQQSKIPTFAGNLTTTHVVPTPPPFVASAVPSVPPVPTTPVVESAGAAPIVSPSEVLVPPVAIAITTFPQLMMAITKGISKGTFTQPDVVKAIEGVGLASIPMLASRPDLIPAVATALGV